MVLKNNPDISSATKLGENIPRYSMSMMWTFDGIERKNDVYWGEIAWDGFVNLWESTQRR